jgi:hypothetical protein
VDTEDKKIVSEHFLSWAVLPAGLPHVDVEYDEYPELYFPGMDSNNPEEVKERVIRPFIVPNFQLYDKASQDIYRDSFQYSLNQEPDSLFRCEAPRKQKA